MVELHVFPSKPSSFGTRRASRRAGLVATMVAMAVLGASVEASASAEGSARWATAGAVTARVDAAHGSVRLDFCPTAPCSAANAQRTRVVGIAMGPSDRPTQAEVTVEAVRLSEGKEALHLRVPRRGSGNSRRDKAWEAVFTAVSDVPLFSGITGLAQGDEGERQGKALGVVDGDHGHRRLLVGNIRESVHVCGEDLALLEPQELDTNTLQFQPTTVPRRGARKGKGPVGLVAVARREDVRPPLVKLGSAVAASSGHAAVAAASDGRPETAWSVDRPGLGRGEFIAFHTDSQIPMGRVVVAFDATGTGTDGVRGAPKRFFLETEQESFAVTVPEDGREAAAGAYAISFPKPITTSCLALVLDEPHGPRGKGNAETSVRLQELALYSVAETQGATLASLIKDLDGDTSAGALAFALLKHGSAEALAEFRQSYPGLQALGRKRLLEVATAASDCAERGDLMVLGLLDSEEHVKALATRELHQCGRQSLPALWQAFAKSPPASRGPLARMIGDLPATSESLVALDRGLGQGPAETRSTLRASLANLVRRADASALKKFFETTPTDREAALDKLRATQPVWQRFPDPTRKLLATVWTEEADFSTRYLASEPLAELARLGDGDAVERLSNLLTKDGDPTMRTRAAQVAGPVAALWDALRGAVDDPEPRVRQAAVVSLTVRPQVGAQRTIAKRLAAEPWTFVRLAGIQALGLLPKTSEGELALAKGLEDKAAAMRLAALLALSTHGPGRHGEAIRRVAQDQEEDVPVRAEAMRALGATCVTSALDELTSWAQQGLAPDASETARELSLGAMEGLAYLRPKNLRQRIANGLDSKTPAPMRQATERVLKLAGRCGNT